MNSLIEQEIQTKPNPAPEWSAELPPVMLRCLSTIREGGYETRVPWAVGDHVICTNTKIAARLPLNRVPDGHRFAWLHISDVPPSSKLLDMFKPKGELVTVHLFEIDPKLSRDCQVCQGEGKLVCQCGRGKVECFDCHGEGVIEPNPRTILFDESIGLREDYYRILWDAGVREIKMRRGPACFFALEPESGIEFAVMPVMGGNAIPASHWVV